MSENPTAGAFCAAGPPFACAGVPSAELVAWAACLPEAPGACLGAEDAWRVPESAWLRALKGDCGRLGRGLGAPEFCRLGNLSAELEAAG